MASPRSAQSTITASFLIIGVVGLQLPAALTCMFGIAGDVAILGTTVAVGVEVDIENLRVLLSHAIILGVITMLLHVVQRNEDALVVTHQQVRPGHLHLLAVPISDLLTRPTPVDATAAL